MAAHGPGGVNFQEAQFLNRGIMFRNFQEASLENYGFPKRRTFGKSIIKFFSNFVASLIGCTATMAAQGLIG